MRIAADELRPLSYAELHRLPALLPWWGKRPSGQAEQYTLHPMKVATLAVFRQPNVPLEIRHLQEHHTCAASATLHCMGETTGLPQYIGPERIRQGWRALTPVLRGEPFKPKP